MRKTVLFTLSLLVAISMLLFACAAPAPATEPVVEEPVVEEPVVEVPAEEPATFDIASLDAIYSTFLAEMSGYNTITVQALSEQLAAEPPPFLLDVRKTSELEEKGYIPGAVHIPLHDLVKDESIALLPSFDTPIVSYCGSGWRCTIALTALEALGWQDVKCLKGGSFGGWVEAGFEVATGLPEAVALNAVEIDPLLLAHFAAQFSTLPENFGIVTGEALTAELAESKDVVLLDVRKPGELEEKGWIDGMSNIALETFIAEKASWPADLDAKIVVYCGSGHRSTIAMEMLWSYGYTNVRSLKGGFGDWAAAGYPSVGGVPALDAAFTTFLAEMVGYNTIKLDALNALLGEEPPPFLLDVRETKELEEKGYIPGAVHIPLRELGTEGALALLPSLDTPIVSYCGSGWRCTIALTALEAMGFKDVKCLKDNSFTGWVEAGFASAAPGLPEAVALNMAAPDAFLAKKMGAVLAAVPEGFGIVTAEALSAELAEKKPLVLLDVRKADELGAGVIEGVSHIAIESFLAEKANWPADKDAAIVVICGSGHRSTIAMTILWSYGYTNVRSLKGGMGGYVSAGYPVVTYAAPVQ